MSIVPCLQVVKAELINLPLGVLCPVNCYSYIWAKLINILQNLKQICRIKICTNLMQPNYLWNNNNSTIHVLTFLPVSDRGIKNCDAESSSSACKIKVFLEKKKKKKKEEEKKQSFLLFFSIKSVLQTVGFSVWVFPVSFVSSWLLWHPNSYSLDNSYC